MSNTDDVAAKIHELKSVDSGTLALHLPHLTRKQIKTALYNAQARKMVKVGKRGGRAGQRKGSLPSTWVPWVAEDDEESADERMEQSTEPRGQLAHIGRVASVWEMGA